MLNPTLWLRIAAVITLIHAVLHTVGGVLSKPLPGVATMVANTMRQNRFTVFGATRSYADFHVGLGLAVTVFLSIGALMFWQLGTLAQDHSVSLRPILITLAIGYAAFAIVSTRYFFWGPAVTEAVIVLCVLLAVAGSHSLTAQ